MKVFPAVILMTLLAGAGAFTHHATVDSGPVRISRNSRTDPLPAGSANTSVLPQIVKIANELLAATSPDCEIVFDDLLSEIKAEEFPLLAHELEHRNSGFWKLGSKLAKAMIEYWGTADPAGLKKAGERSPALYQMMHPALTAITGEGAKDILLNAERDGTLEKIEGWSAERNMRAWAEKDREAAIAFAAKHPALMASALSEWSYQNPEEAFAWMKGPGKSSVKENTREQLLQSLALRDPDRAQSFSSEATDQASFLRSLAEGMIEHHPDRAAAFIERVEYKDGLYERLSDGKSSLPASEIAQWVKSLPEKNRESVCLSIFERLSSGTAYRDPAHILEFAALLPELIPEGSGNFFRTMSINDPLTAIEILQSGKLSGGLRESAIPDIVGSWLQIDRSAALAFLEKQPPSEAVGRLRLEATGFMAGGNKEAARTFALDLPNVALRIGACRRILEQDFHYDSRSGDPPPEEAAKWLLGISDAAVRKALAPSPRPAAPSAKEGPFVDPFAAKDSEGQ